MALLARADMAEGDEAVDPPGERAVERAQLLAPGAGALPVVEGERRRLVEIAVDRVAERLRPRRPPVEHRPATLPQQDVEEELRRARRRVLIGREIVARVGLDDLDALGPERAEKILE